MESIRLLGLNIISSTLKYSDRFLSIKPANQVFYGALGVTAAASLSYGLMARSETAIDDPSNSEEGKLSKKASKNCSRSRHFPFSNGLLKSIIMKSMDFPALT